MKFIFSIHEIENNYFIHIFAGQGKIYPKIIQDKIKMKKIRIIRHGQDFFNSIVRGLPTFFLSFMLN